MPVRCLYDARAYDVISREPCTLQEFEIRYAKYLACRIGHRLLAGTETVCLVSHRPSLFRVFFDSLINSSSKEIQHLLYCFALLAVESRINVFKAVHRRIDQ